MTNLQPNLDPGDREAFVAELMKARRGVRAARQIADECAEAEARAAVDLAKRKLGERGPVWWADGAPDLNRRMAKSTVYAEWFASLEDEGGERLPCGQALGSRPTPSSGDTPNAPAK